MTFNNSAASLIRHGFAREVDVEEGLDLLQEAHENNLVQFGENVREQVNFICNCCGCCCEAMIAAAPVCGFEPDPYDQFSAGVDEATCNGCGKCVQVCPVEAMSAGFRQRPAPPKDEEGEAGRRSLPGLRRVRRNCPQESHQPEITPEAGDHAAERTHRTVVMAIERGKLQNLIFDNQV